MHKLALSGGPRERGQQHGETYRESIRELADIRRGLAEGYFKTQPPAKLRELIDGQYQTLQRYPDLCAEFDAIGAAANVSREDLIILNNYTDMRDFATAGGCSTISVRSRQGAFCGQTWDMHTSAHRFMVHLSIPGPEARERAEVLTVMGCLALAGVNHAGVSVMINNMHCTENSLGLIWPALVRGMILQPTAAGAFDYISRHLPCSGHNYMISDPNEIINVEASGKRVEATYQSRANGVVFHTNHYVGKLKETENLRMQSKTTHERFASLDRYFKSLDASNYGYEQLVREVFLEERVPNVCIPIPKPGADDTYTCGGILIDTSNRRGEMFHGLYKDGDKHEFRWG
ncbi:MAG: C45 family autoproteolytic acyltransferase/hydrolase [Bacteriovoracia bacterium]